MLNFADIIRKFNNAVLAHREAVYLPTMPAVGIGANERMGYSLCVGIRKARGGDAVRTQREWKPKRREGKRRLAMQVATRILPGELETLREYAQREGASIGEIVRRSIRAYVERAA